MMKISVFEHSEIHPLTAFGLKGDFWTINLDTLLQTWCAIIVLLVFAVVGNYFLRRPYNSVSAAFELSIQFFTDLCTESFGFFHYQAFSFVAALFFFVLSCNLVFLLPFIEEPTRDINTTLALGVSTFLYVQYRGLRARGFKGHFKEYFEPFFALFPLHVVGELAKPISMSFRLFGNIMGGSIILMLVLKIVEMFATPFLVLIALVLFGESLPYLASCFGVKRIWWAGRWSQRLFDGGQFFLQVIPFFYFFGIFEGVIQAFVITMLAITYLAMAMSQEGHSAHE